MLSNGVLSNGGGGHLRTMMKHKPVIPWVPFRNQQITGDDLRQIKNVTQRM
jgi:hypothetical protein